MKKKIIFLGCENSHSKQFLTYIKEDKKYQDIEVLGCHSNEENAKNNLAKEFNIKALNKFDEINEDIDGVIVTARNGDFHLEFAKPYFKKGVTAYIDKPITNKEEDAIELVELAKAKGVKLVGGSSLILEEFVQSLKAENDKNITLGGFVRCPVNINNPYGGFYFYSEHLVDIVLYVFGYYPNSVIAKDYDNQISVIFKYDNYEILGLFSKDSYFYSAGIFTKEGSLLKEIPITGGEKCFKDHFDEFYETMLSKKNNTDYNQFIAPIFVLNAIERSYKNNKEEKVRRYFVK